VVLDKLRDQIDLATLHDLSFALEA